MKLTISEMRARHEEAGGFWFSEGAMSFFNTRIESQPNKNNIFITSEFMEDPKTKKYALRQFNLETNGVDTLGEMMEYDTLIDASLARRKAGK